MEYKGCMYWKGFILCRETNTKKFYYAGVRLPAHITTYDEGMHFVDKYIHPKLIKIPKVYSKIQIVPAGISCYTINQGKDFPIDEVKEVIKKEVKENWFYYKTK